MHDFQLEHFPYETPFGLKSIARSPMKMAFLDLDDRFLAVNDAMRSVFWPHQISEGLSFLDILVPSDHAIYAEAKRKFFESEMGLASVCVEVACLTANGTRQNFSLSFDCAFDPELSPRYLRILLRDAREHLTHTLEHSSPNGLFHRIRAFVGAVDQDGILLECEGLLAENTISTGVGRHYSEVFEGFPDAMDRMRRALSGQRSDVKVHRQGRWYHVWYEPTLDSAGRSIGVVWTAYQIDRDLLGEKKLLEELCIQRENVRRREDLMTMTSHEIRSPLATLSMQIDLLEARLSSSAEAGSKVHEIMRMIAKSGRRQVAKVCELAQRTLDASRISERGLSLEFAACDLARLVRDVASRCRERCDVASERIEVLAPESLTGNWDPFRLEQVVENLLSNALKYGGDRPIRLRLTDDGRDAILEVSDQGNGIDAETQKHIFERFERGAGHAGVTGFGMGLYIVQQIVCGHGGSIVVKSAPGEGATFRVTIPLLAPLPSAQLSS